MTAREYTRSNGLWLTVAKRAGWWMIFGAGGTELQGFRSWEAAMAWAYDKTYGIESRSWRYVQEVGKDR